MKRLVLPFLFVLAVLSASAQPTLEQQKPQPISVNVIPGGLDAAVAYVKTSNDFSNGAERALLVFKGQVDTADTPDKARDLLRSYLMFAVILEQHIELLDCLASSLTTHLETAKKVPLGQDLTLYDKVIKAIRDKVDAFKTFRFDDIEVRRLWRLAREEEPPETMSSYSKLWVKFNER